MKELAECPVVLVMLSHAAFASDWVQDECEWAYNLYMRKPERLILPIVVGAYDRNDFDSLLYLESLKRIEGPGNRPYPLNELIARTLTLLALSPAGQQPVAVAPQQAESVADLVTRGKALRAQRKDAEALNFFQRATQLDPNSFDAWSNLGLTLSRLERKMEALVAYDKALALDPNELANWNNKGTALNSLKRYDEALLAFDKALALDPDDAIVWNNKGLALYGLSRYTEALAAYERSIALNPMYTDPRWGKYLSLGGLGRTAEAEEAHRLYMALVARLI